MAVTIEKEPLRNSPSDNPLTFTFYEDSSYDGVADFYFEVELYINTDLQGTYNVIAESSLDDGVNIRGYGKFNASSIVSDYIDANDYLDNDVVIQNGSASYQIKVTAYSNGTGGTQVSSTVSYAWKSALTKSDWIDFQNGDIFADTGAYTLPTEWLTQFPLTENYYVGLQEKVFLSCMSSAQSAYQIDIELFDSSAVSIATATYAFTAIATGIQIDVSPQTIIDNTTITTANFSTCSYYTIVGKYLSGVSTVLTDTYTFHIDLDCTMYDSVRAYFLGKSGNIEAFTFKLANRKRVNVSSRNFRQKWGAYIPDGTTSNNYDYDLRQGGSRGIMTEAVTTIELNSDWISETLQNWLVENMYESPRIYLDIDGVITNAVIRTSSYELKQRINDGLIRETVLLEVSNQNHSMRI